MSYADYVAPEDTARHEALEAFADLLDEMLEMVSENPEDSSALQNVIADARHDARRAAYELTGAYRDECRNQALWLADGIGTLDLD